MRGGRLIFAAVLGATLAASGAARAETFFDALANIFSSDDGGLFQGQVLYPEDVPRGRVVPFQYHRQMVRYNSAELPGTIIIDTRAHYLYYVTGGGQAIRYGVGVGRTGFGWKGTVKVGGKAEWPAWRPPAEMRAREAKRGHKLPVVMAGGKAGVQSAYIPGWGGRNGSQAVTREIRRP